MTSETVLTDEKIHKILEPYDYGDGYFDSARAIEQAVLQSSEVQRLREDSKLLKGLIALCGYVEDGSDTVVKLFQDDATREWFVTAGSHAIQYSASHGTSPRAAINAAMEQQP